MPAGHTCLRPPEARLGVAGSGTTLLECKLLGRRAVGVDINPDATEAGERVKRFRESMKW